MGRVLAALATTAIVPFLACTSFGDAPEDTTPANNDGGLPLDALAPDSGVTDAGDGSAPASNRFCTMVSPKPTQCVDFEDGLIPSSPWTGFRQGGSELMVVTTNDCGPSDSTKCLETRGPIAAAPGDGAGLRLAVGGAPRNISVSGSFRISSVSGGVFDAFSVVMSNSTGGLWVLEVEIADGGKTEIVEYHPDTMSGDRAGSIINVPKGDWTRLTLDLTIGAPSHVVLKIDDVVAAEKDVDTAENETFGHVDFGDVQADEGLTWQVRMDDLTAIY